MGSSMSELVWTFPGGKPKQEVTEIVLVNNVEKVVDITVPTGKLWLLLSIKMVNDDDVNRTSTINKYKEAAKTNLITTLVAGLVILANGGLMHWPNNYVDAMDAKSPFYPELLVAGNLLSIIWAAGGASAGATDVDGLVIEYLEIDAP